MGVTSALPADFAAWYYGLTLIFLRLCMITSCTSQETPSCRGNGWRPSPASKGLGRNRVVVYRSDRDDSEWFSEANRLAHLLKEALRTGSFVLHYQPIVRLADRKVEHYEALIRMRDGDGTLVLPLASLPAAERFGLMPSLTRWVVRQVVHKLRAHPRVRLFVNLSAPCLADEDLLRFIELCLAEGHVASARLGFEIRETTAMRLTTSARLRGGAGRGAVAETPAAGALGPGPAESAWTAAGRGRPRAQRVAGPWPAGVTRGDPGHSGRTALAWQPAAAGQDVA